MGARDGICRECHGGGGNCGGCGGSGREGDDEPEKSDFEKEVDKAYDILWKMYRGTGPGGIADGEGGCQWNDRQEKILHNMISAIDNELGR